MGHLDPITGVLTPSNLHPERASLFGGDFQPLQSVPEGFIPWVQIDTDDLPRATEAFAPGWIYQFFVNRGCPLYADYKEWFRVIAKRKSDAKYSTLADRQDASGIDWGYGNEADLAIEVHIKENKAMAQEEEIWDLYIADSDVFRCPDTGFSYFRLNRETRQWSFDVDFA